MLILAKERIDWEEVQKRSLPAISVAGLPAVLLEGFCALKSGASS
jgi:hypothetical protein